MAQVKPGDSVKVHYTGKLNDGTIFDSSVNREPLQFTLGEGQVIPGFEQGILGMEPGESKTIEIAAHDAYGPYREELVLVVPRDQLPAHLDPQLDQQLQIVQENGQAFQVQVIDLSDEAVTLDANPPLAGKDLVFELQLIEIA